MVDLTKLKGASAWPKARKGIENAVLPIIGQLPSERVDLQLKTVDETDFPGFTRRRVNYFVNVWDRVSAWLFVPDGKDEVPGILCCHDQVNQGKNEPAGIEGDAGLAFAQHYAELGYVTLAPDCITAGDRVSSRLQPYDTKSVYKDNPEMSMVGKMLVDHMHALDAFTDFRRVDPARVGVIGHGLGALNALLLSAFDNRLQACVASCGFTRFETDKDPQRWARDDGMVLLPKLKGMIEKGSYSFDWEHILAMVAPSATLVITSLTNSRFSNPKSCQKAVTLASRVYKVLGAAHALDHFTHHDGHRVTPETLEVSDEWFERWL